MFMWYIGCAPVCVFVHVCAFDMFIVGLCVLKCSHCSVFCTAANIYNTCIHTWYAHIIFEEFGSIVFKRLVCSCVMDALGLRNVIDTAPRKNITQLLRTRQVPIGYVVRLIVKCQTFITTGAAELGLDDDALRRRGTRGGLKDLTRSVHAFLEAHCVPAEPGQIVEYDSDGNTVHFSKLFSILSHFSLPGHIHRTD